MSLSVARMRTPPLSMGPHEQDDGDRHRLRRDALRMRQRRGQRRRNLEGHPALRQRNQSRHTTRNGPRAASSRPSWPQRQPSRNRRDAPRLDADPRAPGTLLLRRRSGRGQAWTSRRLPGGASVGASVGAGGAACSACSIFAPVSLICALISSILALPRGVDAETQWTQSESWTWRFARSAPRPRRLGADEPPPTEVLVTGEVAMGAGMRRCLSTVGARRAGHGLPSAHRTRRAGLEHAARRLRTCSRPWRATAGRRFASGAALL